MSLSWATGQLYVLFRERSQAPDNRQGVFNEFKLQARLAAGILQALYKPLTGKVSNLLLNPTLPKMCRGLADVGPVMNYHML